MKSWNSLRSLLLRELSRKLLARELSLWILSLRKLPWICLVGIVGAGNENRLPWVIRVVGDRRRLHRLRLQRRDLLHRPAHGGRALLARLRRRPDPPVVLPLLLALLAENRPPVPRPAQPPP